MSKIYLIYSNHNDKSTTNSFIEYFEDYFKPHKIVLTDRIQENENNIIIDEFTDDEFVSEIKTKVKKFGKTKIFLVFTEYFNHKGYKVFNNFDLNKKQIVLFESIIIIERIILILYQKLLRPLNLNKINNYASKKYNFYHNRVYDKLKKSLNNYKYFKKRYNGYMKLKRLINTYLIWNNDQKINLIQNGIKVDKIKFIFPYIKKNITENSHGVTISGEVTKYRENLIRQLKKELFIPNNFEEFLKTDFCYKKEFYTYSLNPKKEHNWIYPSLFRYVFSINNNEIPIINDDFNCPITEHLTLKLGEDITLDKINDREYVGESYKMLNLKIEKYIEKIYLPNKKIFNQTFLQTL